MPEDILEDEKMRDLVDEFDKVEIQIDSFSKILKQLAMQNINKIIMEISY